VLGGGDDYELLFTLPADATAAMEATLPAGVPVHCIGAIEEGMAYGACAMDGPRASRAGAMTTSPDGGPGPVRPTWRHLASPVHLLALGFGAGLAPFAPGTFGSVVGLCVALALAPLGMGWNLAAVVLAVVAGVWICGRARAASACTIIRPSSGTRSPA